MYKLSQEQFNQLVNFLQDVPHKYAAPVLQLLNTLKKDEPKPKKNETLSK